MSMQNSSKKANPSGSFWKMSQDSSTVIKGKISEQSLVRWENSGIASRGEFLMLNTLEHPKDADVSTLSEVLEMKAPLKYFLNQNQIKLFIDRLSERKIQAPKMFLKAMMAQASLRSNTLQLGESTAQDQGQKVSGTTGKLTRLTAAEARTLFVRRLMPSECERLQGFPENWTLRDTEQ